MMRAFGIIARIMKTRYDLDVTQKLLDDACRTNSGQCAVADAVREQIPGAIYIAVDWQSIRFSLPKERTRLVYFTPPVAREYIVKFDAGDKVPPFRFQLRNPAYEFPMRVHRGFAERTGEIIIQTPEGEKRKKVSRPPAQSGPKAQFRVTTRRDFGERAHRINQQDSPA